MSKIALQPNASGTGTFTIASPNSNTNRTFTLPDTDGDLLTTTGDGSQLTGISSTPTAAGEVGTYAFLVHTTLNYVYSEGTLVSGSSLRYTGITVENINNSYGPNFHWPQTSGAPSGTWMAMGGATAMWSSRLLNTLFVRIS